jgi:hypothetical protein
MLAKSVVTSGRTAEGTPVALTDSSVVVGIAARDFSAVKTSSQAIIA